MSDLLQVELHLTREKFSLRTSKWRAKRAAKSKSTSGSCRKLHPVKIGLAWKSDTWHNKGQSKTGFHSALEIAVVGECETPSKPISRMVMPRKIVSWYNLSPRTKECFCIMCCEEVEKTDYRRKLFSSSSREKTKVCCNIELLLGQTIDSQTQLVTNIVCRNFATKSKSFVKHILERSKKFKETQDILRVKVTIHLQQRV